jgi:hypothetical protein
MPIEPRKLIAPAAIAGLAGAIWLVFGHGFVQYDTFYALDWGHQLAHGEKPDYTAPLAPTPHPLATFLGFVLAPLGDGAAGVTLAIAFLALGAVAYLLFRLGEAWFNPWVGAAAAVIFLTREPVLSNGVRAYIDVPYLALVLSALLVETRRPRAGWPVLALLGVAGLLRPEAWLLSAAYLVYLAVARDRGVRAMLPLVAIAAAAPLLWGLSDQLIAGDPLHSLSGTRETVETLQRETGVGDAILKGPFRLGEILREPGLFGAAGGLLLALVFLRRRAILGAATAVLAAAAFFVLAAAGLAVITRYLLLVAAILTIFCAAAMLGWLELDRDHPWRRRWAAFGAIVAAGFLAFVPSQSDRLSNLHGAIASQQRILDDLHELADSDAFDDACGPGASSLPITVPNHRPVPFLALWLDREPSQIVSAQVAQPRGGYFVAPASPRVERDFTLDPHDIKRLTATIPPGFQLQTMNRSWDLYAKCGV